METPNRRGRFSDLARQLFEIKCESVSQAEILISLKESLPLRCRRSCDFLWSHFRNPGSVNSL